MTALTYTPAQVADAEEAKRVLIDVLASTDTRIATANAVRLYGWAHGLAKGGPVQRECNACDWKGPLMHTLMCGSVGPLCPECHETTEVPA